MELVHCMEACGLESNQTLTEGERRFAERQWIVKLNIPNGLIWPKSHLEAEQLQLL